ncbi:uncharacterized protein TNCV_190101 [Trichonephila clavipes]|nr:uncharacterized protein TNCV_190101 [Trichonephila clavipes]
MVSIGYKSRSFLVRVDDTLNSERYISGVFRPVGLPLFESGEALRICKAMHYRMLQFPRTRHHSKRRCLWVGVKGSTDNGCRDPKCPSPRHLRMVQENTGASSEGATCAWVVIDEAVDCPCAFITMLRSF